MPDPDSKASDDSPPSLQSPDPETAAGTLDEYVGANAVLILEGECEVDYRGRSEKYAGLGDRLVCYKADGSLLVHRPTGVDPMFWQPSGNHASVEHDEDQVTLTVKRTSPSETLSVVFHHVKRLSVFEADDSANTQHYGTEEDMHDYLVANPDEIESGLRPIEHERSTRYGGIDIYANDTEGRAVLVEVKRRRGSHKHVDQLQRYVSLYKDENSDADVRGILVAPSISDNAERALRDKDLEFVAVDPSETTSESDPVNTSLDDY